MKCDFREHSCPKVTFFRGKVLEWFAENGRHFPWRRKKCDSYEIVVSEILLQRTRAEVVARFFPRFLQEYPSWPSLASAKQDQLKDFLRPLGLSEKRSTTLVSLAYSVLKRGGELQPRREDLESLPGVGQYIANSILTFCFGKREPLLDVNMARLLERFFGPREMSDIRYDSYLQELSRAILSRGSARKLNWAMLDFARLVCTVRQPNHACCPLLSHCAHMTRA